MQYKTPTADYRWVFCIGQKLSKVGASEGTRIVAKLKDRIASGAASGI